MSDSLRPNESQHTRPLCPLPTPRVHRNSRPSSWWCHPAISFFVVPFSSCPQSLPASVFSNESALHIRRPKYWSFSFSISPSKEHPGLISFRMDWLDLLAVQGTLKANHFSILALRTPWTVSLYTTCLSLNPLTGLFYGHSGKCFFYFFSGWFALWESMLSIPIIE